MTRSRSLIVLVAMMLILLVAPARSLRAQDATPEATPAPRFTTTVEVDGRRIGLTCLGSGSPTVLLIGGLRSPADRVWPSTVDAISPVTRVCVFERAGLGPSDPQPHSPQTVADVVADLHAALAAGGEAGPYVPVGFSIGGLIARLYASTYPDEVGGLVLVEGQPPSIAMRVLTILGEDVRAEVTGHDPDAAAPIDELISEAQVLEAVPPRVPTVAILAGKLDLRDLEDPTDFAIALAVLDYNAALHEAQAAQVRDLDARIVYAEESSHLVPFDQPEIIGPAIEAVIAAVRDPSSWATPVADS